MKLNVQYSIKIIIYIKHAECGPESKEKPEIYVDPQKTKILELADFKINIINI